MGVSNCLTGLVRRAHRVKIMKDDGTVIKRRSPAYVREIVGEFPNHGIFEEDATGRLDICSPPLSQSAKLRKGQLYFLIPLGKHSSNGDLQKEELEDKSRKGAMKIVSSSDNGSSVGLRVRIRLSKEEAASFLSIDGNKLMEDLVGPLIQQALNNKEQKSWDSIARRWKPNLETIFEQLSPTSSKS